MNGSTSARGRGTFIPTRGEKLFSLAWSDFRLSYLCLSSLSFTHTHTLFLASLLSNLFYFASRSRYVFYEYLFCTLLALQYRLWRLNHSSLPIRTDYLCPHAAIAREIRTNVGVIHVNDRLRLSWCILNIENIRKVLRSNEFEFRICLCTIEFPMYTKYVDLWVEGVCLCANSWLPTIGFSSLWN